MKFIVSKNALIKQILVLFVTLTLLAITIKDIYATEYDFAPYENMGAIVYDINSSSILLENNADEKYYPGSTVKIMTVLVALDYLEFSDTITVTQEALDNVQPDSSLAGLSVDEQLTFEQLLYACLLPSGNDAAIVIGTEAGHEILSNRDDPVASYSAFIDEMNKKAKILGMNTTNFTNADGYDDYDNYSTPRDMMILAQAIVKEPEIVAITNTPKYELTTNLNTHTWYSSKYFLHKEYLLPGTDSEYVENKYYDDRVTGLKTGFTDIGQRCFMFDANDNNMHLIGIVMEIPYEKMLIWEQTSRLLNYSFDEFENINLVNSTNNSYMYEFSNPGFFKSNEIYLRCDESANLNLNVNDINRVILEIKPNEDIKLNDNGKLTIKKDIKNGDVIATGVFKLDDTTIASVDFTSIHDHSKFGIIDILLYALLIISVVALIYYPITLIKKKIKKGKNE